MCVDRRSFGQPVPRYRGCMATFVIETYLSHHAVSEPASTVSRVASAAAELTADGKRVRYVRSIFIPDDETCLILLDAESEDIVGLAARRAGLDPVRIAIAQAADG
jgi:hypothetical protein